MALTEFEQQFIEKIYEQGRLLYRDLPWRYIDDPYKILVSEVMLQQTQVSRVVKYWNRFLEYFPTIDALAAADTSLVLELWQGLGYNRRALALKKTAEICSAQYQGELPKTFEELIALPGIGKATAAGVLSFAYNQPSLYLETNVRSVFIHEFFSEQNEVRDKQIEPLVEKTCPKDDARRWYYALLDYGNYLKSHEINPSRKSKHHATQSKFVGSRRQKRAEVVRSVIGAQSGEATFSRILANLNKFEEMAGRLEVDPELLQSIIDDLIKEGFFVYEEASQSYVCK